MLPRSGTYSLVIRDNDGGSGGSFRFRLLDAAADSTPYVLDTATAARTLPRYTTDIHRFTTYVGRMLYFDTLLGTDTPTTASYRIIGPSGTQILGVACGGGGCYSMPTYYDSGPALLLESGTYYAIVENQDGESPYRFRILDLSGAGATATSPRHHGRRGAEPRRLGDDGVPVPGNRRPASLLRQPQRGFGSGQLDPAGTPRPVPHQQQSRQ